MLKCVDYFFRCVSIILFSCYCTAMSGCSAGNDTLFKQLSPSASGIHFTNQLQYSDSLSVLEFEYMFNGSGVALIDINNDSLQDIFFGGNMVSSKLYLNKGDLKFEDITAKAGVETSGWIYGIAIVDINNDGFKDIYVSKAGNRKTLPAGMKNIFFINNGDGTFSDKAAEMGLDDNGYDVHAAFLDYDKDGDLDMYLLRNAFVNYNRNTAQNKKVDGGAPSTDKLFRNNGNLTFTDVSKDAGIVIEGFGLGVTVCDLNNDHWPDIYVSNDFLTNDLVWVNNKNGTFTNMAGQYLKHQSYNGMGNDVADYNNDGYEDILVVDMLPPDNKRWKLTMRGNTYEEFQNALNYGYEPQYVRNTLQLNNGDGSFSEIGQLAGVHATEWSWAPLFADFDNDGFKDLFVSNGYRQDITNLDFIRYGKNALFVGTPEANRKERLEQLRKFPGIKVHSYLYANNRDLTFKDVSESWGMTDPSYSNGAAYGDLDNDGDLDLVINKLDQVSAVYENTSAKTNWLRIAFSGPAQNIQGIGTRVTVWQHGEKQVGYFSPYRGYLSSVESFLHFGLQYPKVDSLEVIWPDGKSQLLKDINAGRLLSISYKDASEKKSLTDTIAAKADEMISNGGLFEGYTKLDVSHKEDNFVDFKNQPLLPKMLSHEGPALAVADVNGDGLDDFFTGAAAGSSPVLMLQQKNGAFSKKEMTLVNTADNMGALFFDADNDGDVDLYIASGGSADKNNTKTFTHHLFVNDGKATFSDVSSVLPNMLTSSASVSGADFDRDGDIDLFISGRVKPGEYPLTPKSYLLRNDSRDNKIAFVDVSDKTAQGVASAGMVTTALWTDFNNDGWQDLLLVGEYMPIRFFVNNEGTLSEITAATGLTNTGGWWNSIAAGDFDKDGDMDYVAGNLGLNSPYRASANHPICVYASDFDKDGRIDPVMCHFIEGQEYIVHSRDDINRQMTPMRARFRTYESYADVAFHDAFRKDEIAQAKVFKCETLESAYIENLGNGKFTIKALPLIAQFAPIYSMIVNDFNSDGNPDVIFVGNSYATEVQTGRYDAQGSLLMLGDGKGNFVPNKKALNLSGDNKSMVMLQTASNKAQIIVGSNSDSVKSVFLRGNVKWIDIEQGEVAAIVVNKDGSRYRQEIPYGHSYLSQNSRKIPVNENVTSIEILDSSGKKRTVRL